MGLYPATRRLTRYLPSWIVGRDAGTACCGSAARAAAPAKPRRRSTAHSDRHVEKAEFLPASRASLASVAKLEPGNEGGNADDARVDPHLIGAS